MTRTALWQQLQTYPAQIDRQAFASMFPTPGIVTGMAVTVTTGTTVNIAAGSFVVALGGTLGSALCYSDAVETVTFAAAPASGTSRIDLLTVQVRDAAIDSGGFNDFIFAIVPGTAAASPSPPAVPARAGVLATVTSIGGQANLVQGNVAMGQSAHTIDRYVPPAPPTVQTAGAQLNFSGTNGALGNATFVLRWDINHFDPIFSGNPVSDGRVAVSATGLYLSSVALTLNGNGSNPATAYWQVQTQHNDATVGLGNTDTGNFYGAYPTIRQHVLCYANAGDSFRVQMVASGMSAGVGWNGGYWHLARLGDYITGLH